MFHFIKDGDKRNIGLNLTKVYDGGYVVCLHLKSIEYYFRIRGFTNKAKPRCYFQIIVNDNGMGRVKYSTPTNYAD